MSDVATRVNEVADQIANEGMIIRASRVREAAAEITRQRHEIERLRAALEPSSIQYAMEKAGIVVSESELAIICRKLGIDQQNGDQK